MPKVIYLDNGLVKEVKNLGWLIAHFSEVMDITVTDDVVALGEWDCELIVKLTDNRLYKCKFGSRVILFNWLKTKQWLQGVNLSWFGKQITISRKNELEK